MKITAIGHESWLVQTDNCTVLVDPILESSFGSDDDFQFQIVPHRKIIIDNLPAIDIIIYTSEHLQHFDPRTLKLIKEINNSLIIYIPELLPKSAEDLILSFGFECMRKKINKSFSFNNVDFIFYMPYDDVLFWDNRVSSIYINDNNDSAIFIQSDTKISDDFFDDVNSGNILSPDLMVVTNNFQRNNEFGLDNKLPIDDEKYAGAVGIKLLEELTINITKKLSVVPNILIAGNGYQSSKNTIEHIWSNHELAKIASDLSILTSTLAMNPGDVYDIKRDKLLEKSSFVEKTKFYVAESKVNLPEKLKLTNERIKEILDRVAKTWLITDYGQSLLSQTKYLGRDIGTDRLIIQIEDQGSMVCELILNISKAEFIVSSNINESAMRLYPFGIKFEYYGFCKLISGDLQIWEVLNLFASQWYMSNRYNSPLAFMLEYFSEQVDYDRTLYGYNKIINE